MKKLSKSQLKIFKRAIVAAIAYEESVVDAHTPTYQPWDGPSLKGPRTKSQKAIKQFRKLWFDLNKEA